MVLQHVKTTRNVCLGIGFFFPERETYVFRAFGSCSLFSFEEEKEKASAFPPYPASSPEVCFEGRLKHAPQLYIPAEYLGVTDFDESAVA